jgi:hypothetical protein
LRLAQFGAVSPLLCRGEKMATPPRLELGT